MTDEALVEADRLEEDGRWEEAAVLRLNGCAGRYKWHVAGEAHIWAAPGILRVQLSAPHQGHWYWNREAGGWKYVAAPPLCSWPAPAEEFPRVLSAVEEAVRQVLRRRFGGGR